MSSQVLPAQAKELFRHLFEQASLGIAVEDLDGTLLLANPALCSMLGYEENELCGASCSQFASAEDSQDDWALFQQLREGAIDQYTLEKRYTRKDGVELWGRLNVSLWKSDDGEAPLVFAFVENITERKQAEDALRESEQRFRWAAQAGKMFSYEWNADTDIVVSSAESAEILGFDQTTPVSGHQLFAQIHPDDREKLRTAVLGLSEEKPFLQFSYRIIRPDGNLVWLERTSRAHFDEQGKLVRIVGMATDITERKRSEEDLLSMTRRLIEAQEQERARIARELHDDIGQRLALLAISLAQLQQNPLKLSESIKQLGEFQKQTSEIASDIQTLSHQLHSAKLEYLGIEATMRGFCREVEERTKVSIDFKSQDLPSVVAPDISLCLFRVLQEALRNSAKHSGTHDIEVRLWGTSDEIHLAVSDSGRGFDLEAAKENRGLGLISMEERLRVLKGTFFIESQPERGTRISAQVPLRSEAALVRAAG